MAQLYLHAVDAITGAGDRSVEAFSLIRFQFLSDKTPSEVIAAFAGMANELRRQAGLAAGQY
jgi:hypothetical protein